MCGQVGVIFGRKRRRAAEHEHLAQLFTRLLLLSEERGPHATGAAWLNLDGEHRLFKRPVAATQFINDKAFIELIAGIDNRTTVLLGHTRWRTLGDEQVNQNNHPIRAGKVIGTHNGTIYNANYLFRRYKLPRFAEVDSELLFRLANSAVRNGWLNIDRFKKRLRRCRGQITAIMTCRTEPGTVFMLKGNKPLELRWNKRMRAILYASDSIYLDAVLAEEKGWRDLPVPPMSLAVFHHEDLITYSTNTFEFIAQERKAKTLQ
jgi:glucosamine 6-phosphate synthetase-like amidotransferase/phosphosugar isomerase protein